MFASDQTFSHLTPTQVFWSNICIARPVTTTGADVLTQRRTFIKPATILLGRSIESDLHVLQLAHLHCVSTTLHLHHPRDRPQAGWHGLLASVSTALYKIADLAGTIPQRIRLRDRS